MTANPESQSTARDHVFISYAHLDKDFVEQLRKDLLKAGVRLWIDHEGLTAGTPNWEKAIRAAIRGSYAVLYIASPRAYESDYCQSELALARSENCQIYPVFAHGNKFIDSIPLSFTQMQYIDARGDRYAENLPAILKALTGTGIASIQQVIAESEQADPIPADFKPQNPYKGLAAFTEQDADRFFGRTRFADELLIDLQGQTAGKSARFVAVVGASGSGKSSVIYAGLFPKVRVLPGWTILDRVLPGSHPVENLAISLHKQIGGSLNGIEDDLNRPDGRGLHKLARSIAGSSAGKDSRLLLYVDQFEELFTQTIDEKERTQFITLLATAATDPDGLLHVVLTMRADFYDRPLNYPLLAELMKAHTRPITPLTPTDLYDVITRPAELPDARLIFDDGLVGELIGEVRERGEAMAAALPLLQFTLEQLYRARSSETDRRLTWEAYRQIGGLRGAIATHAEQTYAVLPDDEHRKMARALFIRLIEPGDTQEVTTRRRIERGQIALADVARNAQMQAVANAFTNARLLTSGQHTLEVSHEALIREWKRLGEWLNTARDDIRRGVKIGDDAAEWRKFGNRDALYYGSVLREAVRWAGQNVATADESAFITASEAAENARIAEEKRRARLVRRYEFAGVLAIFGIIGLGVLLVLLINAANRANEAGITAQQQVEAASVQLTAIPPTLQAAAAQLADVAILVKEAEGRIESLRLVALAGEERRNNFTYTAALLSIRALNAGYTAQADSELFKAVTDPNGLPSRAFKGHTDLVREVAYSPDGKTILTGSYDKTAILWDVSTGTQIRTLTGHTSWVLSVAYSPDGKTVLTGSWDNTAILWDMATGAQIRSLIGNTAAVLSVAYSPDGKMVLTGSNDGIAILWDTVKGEQIRTLTGHAASLESVAYSPDGKTVLTGSYDKTAILWDAATGAQIRTLTGHEARVTSVAYSPDGRTILTGSGDNTAILWDAAKGTGVRTLSSAYPGNIWSVAYSPDGKTILTGSDNGTARLWDAATGNQVGTLSGHAGGVSSVAYGPDGKTMITGSDDGTAILWNTARGDQIGTSTGHTSAVASVAYSPDGKTILIAGSDDGTAILWDTATGTKIRTLIKHTDVSSVAYSPDGKTILTGSFDKTAIVWDVTTGDQIRTLIGHTSGVRSVAYSPDGKTILTGSSDSTVMLWDAATGAQIRTLPHTLFVLSVAYSPDGKTLLTGSAANTAILWDAATGAKILTLAGHTSYIYDIAFSSDGKTILTGSYDKTAILWDTATGAQIRTLTGHTAYIYSVAFSPDGKTILTGSSDGTAILWDAATGEPIRTLTGHTDGINSVAFSPDGKHIVTGSSDGTAIIWETDVKDFIATVCERIATLRDFTDEERTRFGITDKEPTCPQFAE